MIDELKKLKRAKFEQEFYFIMKLVLMNHVIFNDNVIIQ
jgi:hypothetical protein